MRFSHYGRTFYRFESIETKLLHTKVQRPNYYKFGNSMTKLLQIKVQWLNRYFYSRSGTKIVFDNSF